MPFDFLKPKPKQTVSRYPTDFLLGDLLVKAGLVSQQQLDEAVKLAGSKNVHVGQMLINFRYISPRDLQAAVDAQSMLRDRTIDHNLAAGCLKIACKTGMTFAEVVRDQHAGSSEGLSNKLGELLSEAGLVTKDQLAKSMGRSQATGLPLGRILVLNGALPDSVLTMALEIQVRIRDGMMTRDEAIEALSAAGGSAGPEQQQNVEETIRMTILQPRKKGVRLGELMVMAGLLNETDVMNALEIGLVSNQQIGQVLVEQGYVSEDLLVAALELQRRIDEDKLTPQDAADALAKIKATGQDVSTVLQTIDIQVAEAESKQIVSFDKMLMLARVVSQDDIDNALEKSAKNSQLLAKVLHMTGYIDEMTMQCVLQCYTMMSNGFLTQDDAIVTLDYCLNREEKISFAEALSHIGWNATLPMQVHGATSVDLSQVKLGLFGTKGETAETQAKEEALAISSKEEALAISVKAERPVIPSKEELDAIGAPAVEIEASDQLPAPSAPPHHLSLLLDDMLDDSADIDAASTDLDATSTDSDTTATDIIGQEFVPEEFVADEFIFEEPSVEETNLGLGEFAQSFGGETQEEPSLIGALMEDADDEGMELAVMRANDHSSSGVEEAESVSDRMIADEGSTAETTTAETESAESEQAKELASIDLDLSDSAVSESDDEFGAAEPIEAVSDLEEPTEARSSSEAIKSSENVSAEDERREEVPSMLGSLLDEISEEIDLKAMLSASVPKEPEVEEIAAAPKGLEDLSLNNETIRDLERKRELAEAAGSHNGDFDKKGPLGSALLKDEYEAPEKLSAEEQTRAQAEEVIIDATRDEEISQEAIIESTASYDNLPAFFKVLVDQEHKAKATQEEESSVVDEAPSTANVPVVEEAKEEKVAEPVAKEPPANENKLVSLSELRGLFSSEKGTNGGGNGAKSTPSPTESTANLLNRLLPPDSAEEIDRKAAAAAASSAADDAAAAKELAEKSEALSSDNSVTDSNDVLESKSDFAAESMQEEEAASESAPEERVPVTAEFSRELEDAENPLELVASVAPPVVPVDDRTEQDKDVKPAIRENKKFDLRAVMDDFDAASTLFDSHEKLTDIPEDELYESGLGNQTSSREHGAAAVKAETAEAETAEVSRVEVGSAKAEAEAAEAVKAEADAAEAAKAEADAAKAAKAEAEAAKAEAEAAEAAKAEAAAAKAEAEAAEAAEAAKAKAEAEAAEAAEAAKAEAEAEAAKAEAEAVKAEAEAAVAAKAEVEAAKAEATEAAEAGNGEAAKAGTNESDSMKQLLHGAEAAQSKYEPLKMHAPDSVASGNSAEAFDALPDVSTTSSTSNDTYSSVLQNIIGSEDSKELPSEISLINDLFNADTDQKAAEALHVAETETPKLVSAQELLSQLEESLASVPEPKKADVVTPRNEAESIALKLIEELAESVKTEESTLKISEPAETIKSEDLKVETSESIPAVVAETPKAETSKRDLLDEIEPFSFAKAETSEPKKEEVEPSKKVSNLGPQPVISSAIDDDHEDVDSLFRRPKPVILPVEEPKPVLTPVAEVVSPIEAMESNSAPEPIAAPASQSPFQSMISSTTGKSASESPMSTSGSSSVGSQAALPATVAPLSEQISALNVTPPVVAESNSNISGGVTLGAPSAIPSSEIANEAETKPQVVEAPITETLVAQAVSETASVKPAEAPVLQPAMASASKSSTSNSSDFGDETIPPGNLFMKPAAQLAPAELAAASPAPNVPAVTTATAPASTAPVANTAVHPVPTAPGVTAAASPVPASPAGTNAAVPPPNAFGVGAAASPLSTTAPADVPPQMPALATTSSAPSAASSAPAPTQNVASPAPQQPVFSAAGSESTASAEAAAAKPAAAPSFWAEALSQAQGTEEAGVPSKSAEPAPNPAVLQSVIIAQLEAQVKQAEGAATTEPEKGGGAKNDLKSALSDALSRLAESYYEQGDYNQAQGLYERILLLKQNQLGSKHEALGADLTNLAGVLCVQGKFADAEPYVKRIATIIEASQPVDTLRLAGCLNTLASVLFQQGKFTECEPLLERSLKLRQEKLGPEHADIADTLRDYAKLLRKLGRNADAETMYAQAKAILAKRPRNASAPAAAPATTA